MQEHGLAGLVGGLLLSLVWMLLLRYSAGLLAWLVVLIVNVLFVACTLLAFTKVRSRPSGIYPGSHCSLCHASVHIMPSGLIALLLA